jgi:hypothetical protein
MTQDLRPLFILTVAALLVIALIVLDLALTGGDTALAYGRHGSS